MGRNNILVFTRTIYDRLRGGVSLTHEEYRILGHPQMLRLHGVHALGNLFYVFPGATGSRIEHMIGTMERADRIILSIIEESEKIKQRLAPIKQAKDGEAIRFSEVSSRLQEKIRRAARIAGLVHDLGHGPYSHNFEPFMPQATVIDVLLKDERLAVLRPYRQALLEGGHGWLTHEAASVILFTAVWHDLYPKDKELSAAVAAILLGVKPEGVDPELAPFIPLMQDIVSSAPVDTDRMDYLERDSESVGVNYGKYEPSRILKSALCVKCEAGFRLGWRESGLAAIVDFLTSRYQMYRQVYFHKTYRSMELMLWAIGNEAREAGLTLVNASSLDAFLVSYEKLTDDYFMSLLCGDVSDRSPDNDKILKLGRALKARKLWKRVVEFGHGEDAEAVFKALQASFPGAPIVLDYRPLKAMRDMSKAAFLMRPGPRGIYVRVNGNAWDGASVLLDALRQTDEAIIRIYLMQEGDSPILQKLREEAGRLRAEARTR